MAKKPLPCPTLLRLLIDYNPETGKLLWKERKAWMVPCGSRNRDWAVAAWNGKNSGKPAISTPTSGGYHHGAINYVSVKAHRVAWAIHHGEWPNKDIDHIDGDPSNNRIGNLRDVDSSINGKNKQKSRRNITGVSGVYWYKKLRIWRARIQSNKKRVELGYFNKLSDAEAAVARAKKAHGFTDRHGT